MFKLPKHAVSAIAFCVLLSGSALAQAPAGDPPQQLRQRRRRTPAPKELPRMDLRRLSAHTKCA